MVLELDVAVDLSADERNQLIINILHFRRRMNSPLHGLLQRLFHAPTRQH